MPFSKIRYPQLSLVALFVLVCWLASARDGRSQFLRKPVSQPVIPVSERQQLVIMTHPTLRGGGAVTRSMLCFSPEGDTLYVGSRVIGVIPARPYASETQSGGGRTAAGAAIDSVAKEVDDGAPSSSSVDAGRAKRDSGVVMGGSISSVLGQPQHWSHAVSAYRISDGKQLASYQPLALHNPQVWLACYQGCLSHDGKYLAISTDNYYGVCIYETQSGKMLVDDRKGRLIYHGNYRGFAFMRNSSQLIAIRDDNIRLYETTSGKQIDAVPVKRYSGDDRENAVSQYAKQLVVARKRDVFALGSALLDAQSAEVIHPSVDMKGSETEAVVGISADAEVLLVDGKFTLSAIYGQRLHQLVDGHELAQLGELQKEDDYWLGPAVVSEDGQLVVCSFGARIFVYSIHRQGSHLTALLIEKIDGHVGRVEAIALSRDRKLLASASADGSTRIWDISDCGVSMSP